MKVTVVGAGAVGASCAEYIAMKNFAAEVVLVDIKEGFAEGKAMDLMQTASLNGFDTKITGTTNDYTKTVGSKVAVITSGIPRKPGMTREELIGINAGIVKEVAQNILKHSPEAIIIVVSNPMDTMAYLVHKVTGLPKTELLVWEELWIAPVSNTDWQKHWNVRFRMLTEWLSLHTAIRECFL